MRDAVNLDRAGEPRLERATSTANSAATITVAADEEQFWAIDWITASYNAGSPDGTLTVAYGGTTVWEVDIKGEETKHFPFDARPLYDDDSTPKDKALTITLSAGGTSVIGKVNARI